MTRVSREERERSQAADAGVIADLRRRLADAESRAERAERELHRIACGEAIESDGLCPHAGRAGEAEAALARVATMESCDECGDREDLPIDATEHHLAHPVTHETTLWGVPVLLCARCAPMHEAAHRKAESKSSGRQPAVVEHETPGHIRIARDALTAARRGKDGRDG